MKGTSMKIGKYPVKHSYKLPRLIADVFSLAFAVLIFSMTVSFFNSYDELLSHMNYRNDNVTTVVEQFDSSFVWRQWIVLIFPALAVAVFAVYLILTLKSHKLSKWNITKRSAQQCYDMYAFCVSLCKIPVLLAIFDIAYITHQKLLGNTQISWFSMQIILDILILAIIIRFTMHRIDTVTAPAEAPGQSSPAVRIKAVAKPSGDAGSTSQTEDPKEEA